ncbi:unnamed protein product, partial [Mesorhabditis belari]|uniref:Uncharacterized protein n=1 Tax=Mesorhabditis belari TaxID=2138241 RepID=A0AAF3FJY3_9BILA
MTTVLNIETIGEARPIPTFDLNYDKTRTKSVCYTIPETESIVSEPNLAQIRSRRCWNFWLFVYVVITIGILGLFGYILIRATHLFAYSNLHLYD